MQTINDSSSFADSTNTTTDNMIQSITSIQTTSSGNSGYSDAEEIENGSEHHGQSEIALLRAVILQAIIDRVNNSKRTEDKVAKIDALNWFDLQNNDFNLICNLAGWSPEWVIEATESAMKTPEKWRRNQVRYI